MADNKKTEIFNKVSEIVADHFDVTENLDNSQKNE